jgi:hypothetical protein
VTSISLLLLCQNLEVFVAYVTSACLSGDWWAALSALTCQPPRGDDRCWELMILGFWTCIDKRRPKRTADRETAVVKRFSSHLRSMGEQQFVVLPVAVCVL